MEYQVLFHRIHQKFHFQTSATSTPIMPVPNLCNHISNISIHSHQSKTYISFQFMFCDVQYSLSDNGWCSHWLEWWSRQQQLAPVGLIESASLYAVRTQHCKEPTGWILFSDRKVTLKETLFVNLILKWLISWLVYFSTLSLRMRIHVKWKRNRKFASAISSTVFYFPCMCWSCESLILVGRKQVEAT
jgi:hypothetical protein